MSRLVDLCRYSCYSLLGHAEQHAGLTIRFLTAIAFLYAVQRCLSDFLRFLEVRDILGDTVFLTEALLCGPQLPNVPLREQTCSFEVVYFGMQGFTLASNMAGLNTMSSSVRNSR